MRMQRDLSVLLGETPVGELAPFFTLNQDRIDFQPQMALHTFVAQGQFANARQKAIFRNRQVELVQVRLNMTSAGFDRYEVLKAIEIQAQGARLQGGLESRERVSLILAGRMDSFQTCVDPIPPLLPKSHSLERRCDEWRRKTKRQSGLLRFEPRDLRNENDVVRRYLIGVYDRTVAATSQSGPPFIAFGCRRGPQTRRRWWFHW